MESRRQTRGRTKRSSPTRRKASPPAVKKSSPSRRASPARTKASPARRASPSRTKVSPVRRSSRPRSTALGASTNTTKTPPSPIKELKQQVKDSKKPSPNTRSNLPSTLTTTTASRPPAKSSTSTSSVHSSYSYASTQKTVEIRSSSAADDKVAEKIRNYLRRSVSKVLGGDSNTPTEDAESRYSRSVSRSVYGDDKAEFSDTEEKKSTITENDEDDEDAHYKSFGTADKLLKTKAATTASPPRRLIPTPTEFGGMLGISFLLIAMPTLIYYLQWTCGRNSCDFKRFNWQTIVDKKYLLDKVFIQEAIGAFWTYNSVLFLLAGIVYGRHVRLAVGEQTNHVYNFNALPLAILMTIALAVAEYKKYAVVDFVLRHYLRFCIYGLIKAFILAFWCYLRADIQKERDIDAGVQPNPYAKTNNFIIRYGLGRQCNPKWLGFVDFKQAFYRISLLTTLLFVECFLYKKIQIPSSLPAELQLTNGTGAVSVSAVADIAKYFIGNVHYDAGAVLAASLLLVYVLDAIIFEHHLASSFELQSEGFGCLLLLRYMATPYLLSAVAKYFFDRRMPQISCHYAVYAAWALLILGLFIKRLSSAIKYKYRTEPSNSHFQSIETIHTFQGRRLLVGSLWGQLRQPNYAGDILALTALALPLSLRFSWPPLISIALLILLLLHRAVRVNARNISKYHSAWVRYCTRVPKYVLPKIF